MKLLAKIILIPLLYIVGGVFIALLWMLGKVSERPVVEDNSLKEINDQISKATDDVRAMAASLKDTVERSRQARKEWPEVLDERNV